MKQAAEYLIIRIMFYYFSLIIESVIVTFLVEQQLLNRLLQCSWMH